MANPEHLAKLMAGVEAWNQWRKQNLEERPSLSRANLIHADLMGADLSGAILSGALLMEAYLTGANLRGADLSGACLMGAHLSDAHLSGADLTRAQFSVADLSGANLRKADLSRASLVEVNLEDADLTGGRVYGTAVWNAKLDRAIQSNLVITSSHEPVIQVDNIEVAQFIYLLLNNAKIRHVIDTITSKVVLILGRFTPKRKDILDKIREQVREMGWLPVLFDFEKPAGKDLTGTVSTLANMARFIIADLTDPSSVPHELATIVPGTVVPVQTILLEGQREYAVFVDLKTRYHWVLEPYKYKSKKLLMAHLQESVIAPAEAKAKELTRK